jgi:hypothetical protein
MKPQHKKYLDSLRASGVTNMLGAAPYLIWRFPDLNQKEAREILKQWMETF